jgi:hypothetical protein
VTHLFGLVSKGVERACKNTMFTKGQSACLYIKEELMFNKTNILFILMMLIVINTVFSQTVTIETALSNATKDISVGVPKGSKIAILNITSNSTNLSDYIINELIVNLVNTRLFKIVPRSAVELAAARREFAFQMSGDVSDDS